MQSAVRPASLLGPLRAYEGCRLLVAVSGGADSVALLRALLQAGAELTVAHLDHALRQESAQDALFVNALAQQYGLPFVTERIDVGAVAARRGWNLEDTARKVRFSFLTRAAERAGVQRILTAHTGTDQAETMLWQLLRGEAVLSGMPVRRGHLERPWLGVGRAEILAYLAALAQPWREDASNADTRFTRNWIRHEVMPPLLARFPGLETSLARLARFQAQDDGALNAQARAIQAHTPLQKLPLALLRRRARLQLAGQPVHAGHLEQIAAALQEGKTLHLTLPGNLPLTVTGGQIVSREVPGFPRPDFEFPLHWTLRHLLPGDRLRRQAGSRKLSDVLGDLKVPRAWRGELWLLASEQGGVQEVQWLGLPAPHGPLWAHGHQEDGHPGQGGAAEQAGQPEQTDPEWLAMGEALVLARQAAHSGEVPVGAVVLHAGRVIAGATNRSRELNDMTRHAELDALRAAAAEVGPYLSGCTLVVTLEPCPMCLGAALEARIGRVVYGAANPKTGALGGVSDLLSQHWGHRPEVRSGLRAGESSRLLRQMFAGLRGPAAQVGEAGFEQKGLHGHTHRDL